jgi:hypothetical protein
VYTTGNNHGEALCLNGIVSLSGVLEGSVLFYKDNQHGLEKVVVRSVSVRDDGLDLLVCEVVESLDGARVRATVAACIGNAVWVKTHPHQSRRAISRKNKIQSEKIQRGTQATRQLITSTINLRMKQILNADPDLSTAGKEQSFRATIAILGGSDGYEECKDEKVKVKKQKKRKTKGSTGKQKKKTKVVK